MGARDSSRGLRRVALLALGALVLGILGALGVLSIYDAFTAGGNARAGAGDDAGVETVSPSDEERIARLEGETGQLRTQLRAQDEVMRVYSATLNQILDHLRSIGDAEDAVVRVSRVVDPELGLVRQDYQSEIRGRMTEIERRLRASRRLETEMQTLLAEVAPERARERIGVTVDALRQILAQKERRIAELESEVAALLRGRQVLEDTLATERENAQRQAERIAELERATVAYLLAADDLRLEALRWQGVLRQRKGTLELTPEALAGERLERHGFVGIDLESPELPLPSRNYAVEVRSIHGQYPELYRLDATAPGIMVLRVEQPVAFWQLSRFLIVELR